MLYCPMLYALDSVEPAAGGYLINVLSPLQKIEWPPRKLRFFFIVRPQLGHSKSAE